MTHIEDNSFTVEEIARTLLDFQAFTSKPNGSKPLRYTRLWIKLPGTPHRGVHLLLSTDVTSGNGLRVCASPIS